ncbi:MULTISPECIES: TlpA family protein disulfide reductase [unclassified Acidiphilium]|uniref:TlpA family protein disulfide reductase n=1 Tax=unclassified Acidiphilium TaxID=2617493 RepID=UPI0025C31B0D|nr:MULTISPECIES: TlpA disulfide reductase family protein [unclassified Acidiphilium]HQT62054.1 TlpA disulfide reductase family protein [Acidiphilium sp.]HQT73043.1 TlpA disulfide reductase family protein [Acidiphilium sp.]
MALLAFAILMIWLTNRLGRRWSGREGALGGQVERMFMVGVIGARVVYVVEHFSAYRRHFLDAFYFWQPGYAVWGGFVFAIAYLGWMIRRRRLSLPEVRLIGAVGVPLSALYIVSLATIGQFAPADRLHVGSRLPHYGFVTIDGRQVNLAALRGRAAVVNIWATWCLPCREEMPLLSRTYAKDGRKDFALVGVDLAEPASRVQAFLGQAPVSYPVWTDPAGAIGKSPSTELFARAGGFAVPTTIFVGRRGIIKSIYVGKLTAATLAINLQKIGGP